MAAAEKELDEAIQSARQLARDQRRRLRWSLATAASYALDTVFLALFAVTGTVPAQIALAYGAAAAVVVGVAYLVTAQGWNLKARDPNLTAPQVMLAVAMQLCVVLAAPQIGFPILANLFTVFAFGMLWLSLRDSLAAWALGVAGTGAVFALVGDRIAVPVASGAEVVLVWGYLSLVLGRCLLLNVNANEMRERLADSRRRLAASLVQVQQLASHDELTGALNRRALISSLERERVRAERSGAPFCIGLMDLDHFKTVNDTYGHAKGDDVLRGFARTVHDTMRVTDVFGRYGGEEFLIILVGTEAATALEAIERIRNASAARDWSDAVPGLVQTVSAGIASFRKGETIEQLLNRADQALYQAKGGGRNRVVVSPR